MAKPKDVTIKFNADADQLVRKIKAASETSAKSLNIIAQSVGTTNTKLKDLVNVHFPKLQAAADLTADKMGKMNGIAQNGFAKTEGQLNDVIRSLKEMTIESRGVVLAIDKMKKSTDGFGSSLTNVTKSNTALLSKMTQQMDQFQKKMSGGGGRGNRGETGTTLDLYINAAKLRIFAAAYKMITGILDETAGSAYRTADALLKLSSTTGESFYNTGRAATQLAKNTVTSSEEIVNLAQKMSGYGKTLTKDLGFFNDVLVLTNRNGRNAEENFKDLVEITGSFGVSSANVTNILKALNIQTEVDIRSVAKLARESKEAGLSFNNLAAIVSTLKSKGIGVGEQEAETLKRVLDGAQKLGVPFNELLLMLDSLQGKTQSIKNLEHALGLQPNDVGLRLMIANIDEIRRKTALAASESQTEGQKIADGYDSIAGRVNVLGENLKTFFLNILSVNMQLMDGMKKKIFKIQDEVIAKGVVVAGIVAGASAGGVAGSAFGPVGTAIGGAAGGIMGMAAGVDKPGAWLASKIGIGTDELNNDISKETTDRLVLKTRDELLIIEGKLAKLRAFALQDGWSQVHLDKMTFALREKQAKLQAEMLVKSKVSKIIPTKVSQPVVPLKKLENGSEISDNIAFGKDASYNVQKMQEANKIKEALAKSEHELKIIQIKNEKNIQFTLTKQISDYEKNDSAKKSERYQETLDHMKSLRAESVNRMHQIQWQNNKEAEGHNAQKDALHQYKVDLRAIELQWRNNEITEAKRSELIDKATVAVRKFKLTDLEAQEVTNTSLAAQIHITEEIEKQIKATEELTRKQALLDVKYSRTVRDHETNMRAIGKSGSVKEMMMFGRDKTHRADTSSDLFKKTGGMDFDSFVAAAKARNAALEEAINDPTRGTKEQREAGTAEFKINNERLNQAYQLNTQLMTMDEQLYAKKTELQDKYYMTQNVQNQFFHDQAVNLSTQLVDHMFAGTVRLKDFAIQAIKQVAAELIKMAMIKGIARFASGGLSDLFSGGASALGLGMDLGGLGAALTAGATGSGINGVGRYANGSRVRGVGADTIPAMLSPGEIVLDKSASDMFRQTMGRGNGQPIIVNVHSYPSLLGNREEMLRLDSGLNSPSVRSVRGRRV